MSLYHLDSSPIWHFKFPQRHLRDSEHHKFQNKIPTTVLCAFILFGRTIWFSYIKIGSLTDIIRIFPPWFERYSHIHNSSQLPWFVIVSHIFRISDKWQISVIYDLYGKCIRRNIDAVHTDFYNPHLVKSSCLALPWQNSSKWVAVILANRTVGTMAVLIEGPLDTRGGPRANMVREE